MENHFNNNIISNPINILNNVNDHNRISISHILNGSSTVTTTISPNQNRDTSHAPQSSIYRNRRVFVLQSYKDIVTLRHQPFNENNHFNRIKILDNDIFQIAKEVGEYTNMVSSTQFDKIELILFIDDCLLQMKMLNQFFDILKEDITRFRFDNNSQSNIPSRDFPTPPLIFEIDNDFDSTPSTASSPSSVSYSPNFQSYNNNYNNYNNNNNKIEICNNINCKNNNCDLCVASKYLNRLSD